MRVRAEAEAEAEAEGADEGEGAGEGEGEGVGVGVGEGEGEESKSSRPPTRYSLLATRYSLLPTAPLTRAACRSIAAARVSVLPRSSRLFGEYGSGKLMLTCRHSSVVSFVSPLWGVWVWKVDAHLQA